MNAAMYGRIEVLLSSADERPHPVVFSGRWLLEPSDDNWSRSEAWSIGWCWGVAEEPYGGIVVYRYHVTRLQPPILRRYPTRVEAINDGVPHDIIDRAYRSGSPHNGR